MRKTPVCLAALLLTLALGSGCAVVSSPVGNAGLFTSVKAPLLVTGEAMTAPKVGTSEAMSILGMVAIGDASIEAAMRDGGITKIQYVDYEALNIMFLYARFTTIVHGE